MTLIELLIAMTVLAIGISAIVAGFGSGMLVVNRAGFSSTVGALADKQMEQNRQTGFNSLQTQGGPQTGSDGRTYWVGSSISWTCVVGPANTTPIPAPPAPSPPPPTCSGAPQSRAVKLVTVEVHKGSTSSGDLAFSESATFDSSTG